jgi:hypothetical protein
MTTEKQMHYSLRTTNKEVITALKILRSQEKGSIRKVLEFGLIHFLSKEFLSNTPLSHTFMMLSCEVREMILAGMSLSEVLEEIEGEGEEIPL